MVVDVSNIKRCNTFDSDQAYQKYCVFMWKSLKLDENYYHSVSMNTGFVKRHGKRVKVVEKISKSDQPTKE